jgi:hypothetical protein
MKDSGNSVKTNADKSNCDNAKDCVVLCLAA